MTPGRRSYEDGCPPGGYDPAARLSVMDDEKIDIALLYPTLGITWEGMVENPKLATAYSRAYNRWIVDFCRHDRKRLVPIAHICLKDPEGAVEEVKTLTLGAGGDRRGADFLVRVRADAVHVVAG